MKRQSFSCKPRITAETSATTNCLQVQVYAYRCQQTPELFSVGWLSQLWVKLDMWVCAVYGRKRGVLSKLSPIVKFIQLVLKRDVEMSPFQDDGSNPSHPSFELNRRTIPECLIFQRSSGAALSTMSANVLLTESINMEVSENDQSISCAIVFLAFAVYWRNYSIC